MSASHAIFLDLDGTLVDTAPGIVAGLQAALAEVGAPMPTDAVLRSWIGPPIRQTLERELAGQGGRAIERANDAFREYFDIRGAREAVPYPGIPEMLRALRSTGSRLIVVTHKPAPLANATLQAHELDVLVEAVHAPLSAAALTTKVQLFADAIERVRPQTAVAVGDRAGDIEAAAVHGIPSVGVTWGYGSAKELTDAGAIGLVSNAAALLEALRPQV